MNQTGQQDLFSPWSLNYNDIFNILLGFILYEQKENSQGGYGDVAPRPFKIKRTGDP